jgi:hypothetical protein
VPTVVRRRFSGPAPKSGCSPHAVFPTGGNVLGERYAYQEGRLVQADHADLAAGDTTVGSRPSQSVDMITELQPVQGTANPTGNLTWSSSVNGAAYSPLMTLTSGGNVGIGTTSPSQKIQVGGGASGDGNVTLDINAYNNAGSIGELRFFDPTLAAGSGYSYVRSAFSGNTEVGAWGGLNFRTSTNNNGTTPDFNFYTYNTALITIKSGGNVGIGSTSPSGILDVEGGTSGSGSGTNITLAAQNGKASGNTNGGNIILTPGTANGTGSAGAVGIGTSSPAASVKADINGMVKVAGTGTEPCTAAQVGSVRYNPTGNYFELCSYP